LYFSSLNKLYVLAFINAYDFFLHEIRLLGRLIVFLFSLSQTGYIGALPHLLMTIVVPLGGLLADHIRKNGILSTTSVRKIFNCGGFGMEATFFLVLANARTPLMATIALTCGVAFSGFAISGKCSEAVLYLNLAQLSPNYNI